MVMKCPVRDTRNTSGTFSPGWNCEILWWKNIICRSCQFMLYIWPYSPGLPDGHWGNCMIIPLLVDWTCHKVSETDQTWLDGCLQSVTPSSGALWHIYWVHDDVINWKHIPRYWPFVREIQRSPVTSPHKGQWRGALMGFFICARINGCVNNREAGDLRRHCAVYDVMFFFVYLPCNYFLNTFVSLWPSCSGQVPIVPHTRCMLVTLTSID